MHAYLIEAKTLRDYLRTIGADPSELVLVLQVLNGLPAEYDSIVNPLLAQTPLPSFTHVCSLLLGFDSRVQQRTTSVPLSSSPATALVTAPVTTAAASSTSLAASDSALVATSSRDRNNSTRSHYRGRRRGRGRRGGSNFYSRGGYMPRPDFFSRSYNASYNSSGILGSAPSPPTLLCQYCGAPGHVARSCPSTVQQSLSALQIRDNVWYPDTGASVHMTHNPGMLLTSTPYHGPDKISVGDGTLLSITAVGTSQPVTPTRVFHLRKVFYVPSYSKIYCLSVNYVMKTIVLLSSLIIVFS
ncbi:hypothetical protein Tsubulata_050610 [Turnera subulata]|uniref:CCHC-type domain-containing protein n=1 Tax=Turnera subulata TaxID=218843 RepID=A0A9Q0GD86_9ROSI|nr:hypothetical protein Tsubulata_050610 [Turnera subulata]